MLGSISRCLALLALLAAPTAAFAAEPPKCAPLLLWGDGAHDDTLALNAWWRGDPVIWAQTGEAVGDTIASRDFRLSSAIYVPAGSNRTLQRFRMLWPERHEIVSGDAVSSGGDPDAEPVAINIHIVGGDSGEGVPFSTPDPPPSDHADRSSCLTS
jgi:hypothetical protein